MPSPLLCSDFCANAKLPLQAFLNWGVGLAAMLCTSLSQDAPSWALI